MSIPFSWLYLLHDPHTNLYKIGHSDNPRERLKQLCLKNYNTIPASPTNYELVEAWLCPIELEQQFHQVYADCRVRGEWFDLAGLWESPASTEDVMVAMTYGTSIDLESYRRLTTGKSMEVEIYEQSAADDGFVPSDFVPIVCNKKKEELEVSTCLS